MWDYVYDSREALPKDDPNALGRNLMAIEMLDDQEVVQRRVEYDSDWFGLLFQAKAYPNGLDDDHYYQTDYWYDNGGSVRRAGQGIQ